MSLVAEYQRLMQPPDEAGYTTVQESRAPGAVGSGIDHAVAVM